nr:hypothetical protein [Candidatus Njordarchaeota archaeon]
MDEKELYDLVKGLLEKEGFYPVKKEPSIVIKGYRPDVTGVKGKEVRSVEVKLNFDERSVMSAISQAKVYQLGSTHAYVAFERHNWDSRRDLQDFVKKQCEDSRLGVYIVDVANSHVDTLLKAKLSAHIDLDEYDRVCEQLEGKEWVNLRYTLPEYVRDICVTLFENLFEKRTTTITREQLFEELKKRFPIPDYWLVDSRSPQRKFYQSKAVANRIRNSIDVAIELGFLEVIEVDEQERENDRIGLSYTGMLLSKLSSKPNVLKPSPLDSRSKSFLIGYLVKYPIVQSIISILQEHYRAGNAWMYVSQLVEKLESKYGKREYSEAIHFLKYLDIFFFPTDRRFGEGDKIALGWLI